MSESSIQPDFFLPVYNGQQSLRDSLDFMSLPFFASEKGPAVFSMETKIATERDTAYVRLKGNQDGVATIFDKRLLVYIHTLIIQAINDGLTPSRQVNFTPYDYFKAIGKSPGKQDYERLKDSLRRLKGTTIETDRTAGEISALSGVGWIDSYSFKRKVTARGEMNGGISLVLSEWLFEMMTATSKTLSVHPGYFKLTSGVKMRIYELCRRFVGHQTIPVRMNLELFHQRLNGGRGRTLDIKYAIKAVHEEGGILGYDIEVAPHRPRTPPSRIMVEMKAVKGPNRVVPRHLRQV
ncbi:Replication initiator protein A [Oceanicaulis sp. 350]|nr:Replication initiator protein A [Oceanicaulis sp. 350]